MRTMYRRTTLALLAIAAAGTTVPVAHADGLPVIGVMAGPAGVTTPRHADRFTTLAAAPYTVVARVVKRGGRVVRSALLPGTYVVPVVAYDGTAGGLSADGRTLVLITPRLSFPRVGTPLALLDARTLKVRRTLVLGADFSFDAVSPDGRWVYLIEYIDPVDPNAYRVRVLDARNGRLLDEPIGDPTVQGAMRGAPVARAASPDGRWAYTLYDAGGDGSPFVHALDTARRQAVCIELRALKGRGDLMHLRLGITAGGDWFTVRRGVRELVRVDTRTFAVESV